MTDSMTVDLYADPDGAPIATGVSLERAFPNNGMRRAAEDALRLQGQFWCDPGYMETTLHPNACFAAVSPLKTTDETLGNYAGAHDTATYLDAFGEGLRPVVAKLEAAKAELASCGASEHLRTDYDFAVAGLLDALASITSEAESCR